MLESSRIVYIQKRQNSSEFYRRNMDVLKESERLLGVSNKAVAAMLMNGDELKVLMPSILAIDPRSHTSNWDKVVSTYWNSLSIGIGDGGKKLEIGMIYDIYDSTTFFDGTKRIDYIKQLQKENPSIKTNEDLKSYIEGVSNDRPNISENEKYKYCKPINVEDYLLWRYCEHFYQVAPNIDSVDKSPNIRFFIHDTYKFEEDKKKAFKLRTDARKAYMEIFTDESMIDNMIYIFSSTYPIPKSMKELTIIDKQIHLENIVNEKPEEFIRYRKDKNLQVKSMVEMYIYANILKRLPNSKVVVDGDSPEIIIGNSTEEVIRFFMSAENKVAINQYEAKFKGLKK